jgi:hypothetical protein
MWETPTRSTLSLMSLFQLYCPLHLSTNNFIIRTLLLYRQHIVFSFMFCDVWSLTGVSDQTSQPAPRCKNVVNTAISCFSEIRSNIILTSTLASSLILLGFANKILLLFFFCHMRATCPALWIFCHLMIIIMMMIIIIIITIFSEDYIHDKAFQYAVFSVNLSHSNFLVQRFCSPIFSVCCFTA